MQNINELIGIYKGIDFDNVINEHEVLCLKTWVDKSRNLANTLLGGIYGFIYFFS